MGFTLLEILIAMIVFILAAVPIYFALGQGAAQEVQATKIAQARKILESFRQEIMGQEFNALVKMMPASANVCVNFTEAELKKHGLTMTAGGVIDIQREYKDFEMGATFCFAEGNNQVIEVKSHVSWTRPGNEGPVKSTENLAFLVVKP